MRINVGTSGWMYADWRGRFYPEGVPRRLWLERYAECFGTVENNNAFYRLPSAETFAGWRERTPPGFVMAVKASRFLTHVKRLREPGEPVERLMAAAGGLGDRLGPILLQLPPSLTVAPALLDDCLARFPSGVRVAVEPRHDSWWTEEVRETLSARGAALCWADRLGRPLIPLWRTARWGYLRLHEGRARPLPSYGDASLASWLRRIGNDWDELYVYFNNDQGGAAVRDASRFAGMAREAGHELGPPLPAGDGSGARRSRAAGAAR
ncbi:histidine kinase [Microtetraspora sp. NBRC 13810]|uniref:DUF72 domain-containing protein n=1 Tax=Microtetraspora sp. NBRC 13810 TaxID=3030990 RepID=UPI0024A41A56|nr:DUF72 domain-containing protein [Microtetraspora sp. NBRC 13810]GLW06584.1 histidine kinase [Microtetraspora sp. NBRC 13810]